MLGSMAEPLRVKIADLRSSLDRALCAAEDLLGEEVALPADYYWHLPVDAAFDMTTEPRELTVGQLSDDVEALLYERDPVPQENWHELSHLIGVLRALELAARS